MDVTFFNREIENPVLKVVVMAGAAVFAAALIALVFAIVIPVIGAVLTGVLLVVAVVLILVLILVPILSFIGLLAGKRIRGSGVKATEVLELEPFDSLKVSGAMKAHVICGGEQRVALTTDDNLIESVEAVVKDGRLELRYARPVITRVGMKLDITVPEFREVRVYGASKITVENLKGEEFGTRISGAASIRASGAVDTFKARISGAGSIKAGDLQAGTVRASISGAGKARVHAVEKLEARISGAGSIACSGQPPVVEKNISGAGKVTMV